MSEDALIAEISRRLADAAPARTRVGLFGSRARGDSGARSGVDVLVIEQAEADRRSIVQGTVIERAPGEGRTLIDA